MIKKTLYFGNPAYLSLSNKQLVIKFVQNEQAEENQKEVNKPTRTIPIEDIGVVVLDNPQITITHGLIEALLNNTAALITCDNRRMPSGLLLPLEGNIIYNERFRNQLEASLPLQKQLWQQTVKAKITNQANLLSTVTKETINCMYVWAYDVKSGDSDNMEARAAAFYWRNIFEKELNFARDREGDCPNNLLNYGYAILRAVVARSLVISGLLPLYGIHHHNRYNAYCLADDIMEPYRPFVDKVVLDIMKEYKEIPNNLTKEIKAELLKIPDLDVIIGGRHSPLMVAVLQTTSSLAKCFNGEIRKISYPIYPC